MIVNIMTLWRWLSCRCNLHPSETAELSLGPEWNYLEVKAPPDAIYG